MNEFTDKIIEMVKENRMTFAEFMDKALYDPEHGYYQKENPFGIQGSFYTSVDASSSFGRTISDAMRDTVRRLSLPANFCEMGAGSGMLACDVLDRVKEKDPDFYEGLSYTIIEKSAYLIERQKEVLKEHEGHVKWIAFEELNGFEGVFFSNELVDAFPVHRVIRINDELKELFVIHHEGKLTFWPDDISDPAIKDYLDAIGLRVAEGQIVEINLNMLEWQKQLASKISRGVVFTVDYGYPAEQLFESWRRDGTVTCYFKHTQNNDFFERVGYQDITAFVDFTSLENAGKDNGLEPAALLPQWLFLVQAGILGEIENAGTDLEKASIKSLIMPEGGFGQNFFVLVQHKGVELDDDFPFTQKAGKTFDEMLKRMGG
ncbi:class I SAM-dependent methyltransferase [Limisalsivibrio acetivorans]|uniref:class I SAM-dependent methyltransferase n=1 Tax=Limisalsivibrio acetivorans TaxID=1304888 RepID=UPI0003B707D7|nr:SAM-dependent methyltransferase [Limisalsivibrio acetivorans]